MVSTPQLRFLSEYSVKKIASTPQVRFLSEYSVQKIGSTPQMKKNNVQVFHFKPDGLPHFITIIYPTAANNTIFEDYRLLVWDLLDWIIDFISYDRFD